MTRFELNAEVGDEPLNELFRAAWPNYDHVEFGPLLEASLLHVLAYEDDELVGFVRVVPCGLTRGFVLGPTVRPSAHGKGIGSALLDEAAQAAKQVGMKKLLVEFRSELRSFYQKSGFRHTAAGIRKL